MPRLRLFVLLTLLAAAFVATTPTLSAVLPLNQATPEPAATEEPNAEPTEEATEEPTEETGAEEEATDGADIEEDVPEESTTTPAATETAAASPAASPAGSPAAVTQLSSEECLEVSVWFAELLQRFEEVGTAIAEAGFGTGTMDPAAVDLDPDDARELANLIEETLEREFDAEVPAVVQDAEAAYLEYIAAIGRFFNDYADAVEAGANPEEAVESLSDPDAPYTTAMETEIDALAMACGMQTYEETIEDIETTPDVTAEDCQVVTVWYREGVEQYGEVGVALSEAGLGDPTALDPATINLDADTARDLADLIEDFVEEQDEAEVADAAEDAWDTFRDNQEAIADALEDYADALDDGDDPDAALADFLDEYAELSLAAHEPLNALLAACQVGTPSETTPETQDGVDTDDQDQDDNEEDDEDDDNGA